MKTKDLIEELKEYNPDAEIRVIVSGKSYDFTLAYGAMDGEGIDKEATSSVSLYVDELNTNEAQSQFNQGKKLKNWIIGVVYKRKED